MYVYIIEFNPFCIFNQTLSRENVSFISTSIGLKQFFHHYKEIRARINTELYWIECIVLKSFLTYTGRILVLSSGVLLMWGFHELYGKYSNPVETLTHIPNGRFYVLLLVVGIYMVYRGNRLPY